MTTPRKCEKCKHYDICRILDDIIDLRYHLYLVMKEEAVDKLIEELSSKVAKRCKYWRPRA